MNKTVKITHPDGSKSVGVAKINDKELQRLARTAEDIEKALRRALRKLHERNKK